MATTRKGRLEKDIGEAMTQKNSPRDRISNTLLALAIAAVVSSRKY
jgi:hypothetical protein